MIDHVDQFKKIDEQRAVLVQAKMLNGGVVKPSGKEWVQHELLAWLPVFTFIDASYDLRSRNFLGMPLVGSPMCTAEYGGIDLKSSSPEWRHELTQKAAPWFNSPVSIGNYIAGMVTGNIACSREAVRGGLDDWSFTVDELLRVTAACPITKSSGVARGNDNVIGLIVDTSSLAIADDGGGDGDSVELDLLEWPDGPISTVHLTLSSIDDRPEE